MRICFPHKPSSQGGPGTFQNNLESFLKKNHCEIIYPQSRLKPDLIFVVAGTRKVLWLLIMKLRGVKIIHRLDGMNWKYKLEKISYYEKFKQIIQNFLIFIIRNYLSDFIVYQSNFVKEWWEKEFGKKSNSSIIVNGSSFHNHPRIDYLFDEAATLTCVEGSIQNDLVTNKILSKLNSECININGIKGIEIFGNHSQLNDISVYENINFRGSKKRTEMLDALTEKKRIFVLLELNPPCPNSMIEALCLGIPCVGFNSGSFDELLKGAGISLPYDSDVWKLEPPNLNCLIDAINNVVEDYENLSNKAFKIAKDYSLDTMCKNYFEIIQKQLR